MHEWKLLSSALVHTSLRSVCMSGNYLLVAHATCASEKYLIVMNLCKNKNASWRSVFERLESKELSNISLPKKIAPNLLGAAINQLKLLAVFAEIFDSSYHL